LSGDDHAIAQRLSLRRHSISIRWRQTAAQAAALDLSTPRQTM